MLTDKEIRSIAQKIVDESKRTSHVDTGALKRSISFTYVKEVVIFRMIYYGQWNDNAKLEENANRYMPSGVQWKIIYTKFGGDTYEVGKTRTGRTSTRKLIDTIGRISSNSVNALINKIRGKKKN